jgi:hypothetical protein
LAFAPHESNVVLALGNVVWNDRRNQQQRESKIRHGTSLARNGKQPIASEGLPDERLPGKATLAVDCNGCLDVMLCMGGPPPPNLSRPGRVEPL